MINLVNRLDGSSKPFLYRGEDCMDVFVKQNAWNETRGYENYEGQERNHNDGKRLEGFQNGG